MRPVVRIDVGARWLREAVWLVDAEVGGSARVDLDVLRAPIDLVVRARNLTESLPDEPVVPLLDALAGAVSDLSAGLRTKALVPFFEAPWELAIVRHGDDVHLTLYELTAPARVVAEGIVVPLQALRRAVARALEGAMDEVRDAVPSRAADDLLGALRTSRRRLDATITAPRLRSTPVPAAPFVVETRAPRFALRTALDDACDNLLAYDGEHPHDRHALLAPGVIEVSVAHGPTLQLRGRPLALLDAAGTHLARLMTSTWPIAGELARTPNGRWVLELDPPRATLAHVEPDGARRVVDFDASDLVTAWCDHVVDVLGACLRANPLLEANELVVEAMESAELLRSHTRRALAPLADPLAAVPASQRATLEAWPAHRPAGGGPLRDVRRLRFERTWSSTRRGMRRSLPSIDAAHRLVVCDDGVSSVRTSDGVAKWTIGGAARRMRTARLGPGRLVTVDQGGDLVEHDAATGAVLRTWSSGRRVRRVDDAIWCRSSAAFDLVVSVGDGRILALGDEPGPLWTATVGTSSRRALAVCADLVLAASRDGGVVALRPEGGERVWTERVEYDDVQIAAGRRFALVTGASPLEARGFVGLIDGATGRWRLRVEDTFDVHDLVVEGATAVALLADPATETRNLCAFALDAGAAGARVAFSAAGSASARARLALCGDQVVVAEPRRVSSRSLAAPGDVRWSVDLEGFGRPAPRIVAWPGSTPLVAWADDEALVVVAAESGEPLARVDAFWEQLDALAFDEDGALLVVERRAQRDRTVHRLALVGMLSVVK